MCSPVIWCFWCFWFAGFDCDFGFVAMIAFFVGLGLDANEFVLFACEMLFVVVWLDVDYLW